MWCSIKETFLIEVNNEREDSNRKDEAPAEYIMRYIVAAKHLEKSSGTKSVEHRAVAPPPPNNAFVRGEIITFKYHFSDDACDHKVSYCWLYAMIDSFASDDQDNAMVHIAQPCHHRYFPYRDATRDASLFNLLAKATPISLSRERAMRWANHELYRRLRMEQEHFYSLQKQALTTYNQNTSSQIQNLELFFKTPPPPAGSPGNLGINRLNIAESSKKKGKKKSNDSDTKHHHVNKTINGRVAAAPTSVTPTSAAAAIMMKPSPVVLSPLAAALAASTPPHHLKRGLQNDEDDASPKKHQKADDNYQDPFSPSTYPSFTDSFEFDVSDALEYLDANQSEAFVETPLLLVESKTVEDAEDSDDDFVDDACPLLTKESGIAVNACFFEDDA